MKKEQARKRLPRSEISTTLKAFGIKPRKQDPCAEVEDYSEEVYIFLENLINHSSVETGAELMELAEAAAPYSREIFEMYRLTTDEPDVLRVRFPCYVVDELVLKKPVTDEESAEVYNKVRSVFTSIHAFYMDHDLEIPDQIVRFDCDRPQAINFDQAYTLRLQLYQMNMPAYMKRPVDSRGIPIGH